MARRVIRSGQQQQQQKTEGVEDLARRHVDAAIATLVEVCGNRDAPPAARVAAATALLDRAYGKPRQAVEHAGEVSQRYVVVAPPPSTSVDEWLERHAPKDSEPA
jgi:hypothetical protein